MIGNNLGTIYIFVPLLKIPIMKATAFIRKSASKNDTNSVATNINKPNAKNPLHEKYFNYLSSWHDT